MQERGLYFADKWDPRYETPLAMHDPGEPALAGGLLWARHGKGAFVYTGLAFFRQLPAGVPGRVPPVREPARGRDGEAEMTRRRERAAGDDGDAAPARRDGRRAAVPDLARDLPHRARRALAAEIVARASALASLRR